MIANKEIIFNDNFSKCSESFNNLNFVKLNCGHVIMLEFMNINYKIFKLFIHLKKKLS